MEINQDTITTGVAILGLGIAAYTLWRALRADKVRLKVVPKGAAYRGTDSQEQVAYLYTRDRFPLQDSKNAPHMLAVEIINVGKFAVVVSEVGLGGRWHRMRTVLVKPLPTDGSKWPRRLEPRDSVTVLFEVARLLDDSNAPYFAYAYAATACGTTCKGSSGALKELARAIRAEVVT